MPHDDKPDNTLEIVFIVNGETVPVPANMHEPLRAAMQKALEESHNTGRPPADWEIRDAQGTFLDRDRKLGDYQFPTGVRLFLNLQVAAGGV